MNDLDLDTVLRKTPAGAEAIKTRDRALTPRLRMLLIMVDGIKTGAELLKSIASADDASTAVKRIGSGGVCRKNGSYQADGGSCRRAATQAPHPTRR